ncbi:MAG TPA: hypothetical protein VK140_09535 [Ktedonobacteraceae bacterium]|nr:hypothetical protein [Ktedonobacteraceae bacterium]
MSDVLSEVAYFRQQQALCDEAARLGLSGLAITATHESITARMQRGAERILRLIEEGKHEEAQALLNAEDWSVEEQEKPEQQTGIVIGIKKREEHHERESA